MFLVDSHCHLDQLDLAAHQGQLDLALDAARSVGVKHFLCVSTILKDFQNLLSLASRYADVTLSVGLHPNEHPEEATVEQLVTLGSHPKVVAIGETGLDYYRSVGDLQWQRERFKVHIRAAKLLQKPLIVHMRDATEDTLDILESEKADTVGGVLHCFTADAKTAKILVERGFYISFSGIVTFKNAGDLPLIAKEVPQDRILIETDSPYLAPVPFRGKSNQPAYVRYVAECLATLRDVPLEEFARQTTENFFRLFKGAS